IDRNLANVRRWKSGEGRRFLKRVMHFARTVERRVCEVIAEKILSRGGNRSEIRERAAGREHAARTARQSKDFAEPADDIQLELRQRRRRGEDADVTIDRVSDQISDRRVKNTAARNVREISGTGGVERA